MCGVCRVYGYSLFGKKKYLTGAQVTDGLALEVCGQRGGLKEGMAVLGTLPF